ncbi:MAG: DUF6731 family protein [Lachnospiraceae bacterium]|nr:DUF6731 family protein [Lachnospiraceae bacterium]
MSYSKLIKFDFCQLYIKTRKAKSRYSLFLIEHLIKEISDQNLELKEIDVYDGLKVRIEKLDFNKENSFWYLRVLRLRDSNLSFVVRPDEEAKPIELGDDEYLGEDLTMLFDIHNNVAMMQRNRHSMGITNLQKFIEKVIGKDEYKIEIRPISIECDVKKIEKDYFKSLELRFANLKGKDIENVGGSLGGIIRTYEKLGGGGCSFVVNLGRTKRETLAKEQVREMMDSITEHKDLFSAAILKARNAEDNDVDIINLFENVLSVYVWFTIEKRMSLDYQVCIDNMTKKYLENKGKIKEILRGDGISEKEEIVLLC